MRAPGALLAAAVFLTACGKLPESETAKKIGAQPKQAVDRASQDAAKALQAGAQARQDAEPK